MAIIYAPPTIVSVHELTGEEIPFEVQSKGKFVMTLRSGEDDILSFCGMLYTNNSNIALYDHGDILMHLQMLGKAPRDEALWIGGGFIFANHAKKQLFAHGASYTMGGVPCALVTGALALQSYTVDVHIDEKVSSQEYPPEVMAWYRTHNFLNS